MCGFAQDISNSRKDSYDEKWSYRKDQRPKVSEHRVRNIEKNDDDQDAVDGGHHRLRKRSPVADEVYEGAYQHNTCDNQQTDHDCVLDGDDESSNRDIGPTVNSSPFTWGSAMRANDSGMQWLMSTLA